MFIILVMNKNIQHVNTAFCHPNGRKISDWGQSSNICQEWGQEKNYPGHLPHKLTTINIICNIYYSTLDTVFLLEQFADIFCQSLLKS